MFHPQAAMLPVVMSIPDRDGPAGVVGDLDPDRGAVDLVGVAIEQDAERRGERQVDRGSLPTVVVDAKPQIVGRIPIVSRAPPAAGNAEMADDTGGVAREHACGVVRFELRSPGGSHASPPDAESELSFGECHEASTVV